MTQIGVASSGERTAAGTRARRCVFVQARMSSRRFPGKVLAPLGGEPIIRRVLRAVATAVPGLRTVVVTSADAADDPLATYVTALGIPVFRGPRDDVLERFRLCALRHPCDFILRVCADSPLLDGAIIRAVLAEADRADADLVTTTFPRTFPRGQNVELIRLTALTTIPASELTSDDREHVTAFFYRHPDRYRIVNVAADGPRPSHTSLAVDTIEDLYRLEALSADEAPALATPQGSWS
jgi:spore coat polysaccharide biosynthesis protein SpsF